MTLYDLVNTRYEAMLTTIYTSQYSLPALQERLSRAHETETAKAIVSRIRETCLEVRLYGFDLRTPPTTPARKMPTDVGRRGELGRFGDADTAR